MMVLACRFSCFTLDIVQECADAFVDEEVAGAGTSTQEQSVQACNAGDGDVRLAGGEGPLGQVDEDPIEGATLSPVYGDGPAQYEGKLAIPVGDFLRELPGAEDEPDLLPHVGRDAEFTLVRLNGDAVLHQ